VAFLPKTLRERDPTSNPSTYVDPVATRLVFILIENGLIGMKDLARSIKYGYYFGSEVFYLIFFISTKSDKET
jgi:hypothetical protein